MRPAPGSLPPTPCQVCGWRAPHLCLQEAAVGGVGCASPLSLLAFALDLWKGPDAAVMAVFLPWEPWMLPLRTLGTAFCPAASLPSIWAPEWP